MPRTLHGRQEAFVDRWRVVTVALKGQLSRAPRVQTGRVDRRTQVSLGGRGSCRVVGRAVSLVGSCRLQTRGQGGVGLSPGDADQRIDLHLTAQVGFVHGSVVRISGRS
ncbi:hypothetical protein [Ornithinimicrobium kibberense]|uniref:hypothetical protein n=1 Tax=Ornithinimicrobium kibberense TaxID=282060 RepID=UPI00360BAA9E